MPAIVNQQVAANKTGIFNRDQYMNGSDFTGRRFVFAGGGTGGHIYPAIAVAEEVRRVCPEADIEFFCSNRDIDNRILSHTHFAFCQLDARGFSFHPIRFLKFAGSLVKTYFKAKRLLDGVDVIVGCGGFVSVPVVLAGRRLGIDVALVNVDVVPGKANKLLKRFAKFVFVQFDDTVKYFAKSKASVEVVGCPLRAGFKDADGKKVAGKLGLDREKKVLLVTGASSGAINVNKAMVSSLGRLGKFKDAWQIVHLTGRGNYYNVKSDYERAACGVSYKLLDYFDDMAGLYAAADLVVGRGGAVSVAEFAAAGLGVVCLPYPYHKDKHQYLNAGELVAAGAAVIVEDRPDAPAKTAKELGDVLEKIMGDEEKLKEMAAAARGAGRVDAAEKIAIKIKG